MPRAWPGGLLRHSFAVPPGAHIEGLQLRIWFAGKGYVRIDGVTFEAGMPCE